MRANSLIIRYLAHAKKCLNAAIDTTSHGKLMECRVYLEQAVCWLKRVDRIIIYNHLTVCLPSEIRNNSADEVMDDIIKTYKYAHV